MLPKLIVGLGNPGPDYQHTRHNLGYLVVQRLAKDLNCSLKNNASLRGYTASGVVEEQKFMLLLPTTFMNLSGVALKLLLAKSSISLGNILVVCDDLNLSWSEMRLKPQGSAGGHNGLKSIIEHLASNEFSRLRIGINHPGSKAAVSDYVLKGFSKEEMRGLDLVLERAVLCCRTWLTHGTKLAMDQFNGPIVLEKDKLKKSQKIIHKS